MHQQTRPFRLRTRRWPYIAGLLLLAVLVGFQAVQIYRYRQVVIKNDENAALLAHALEQLDREGNLANGVQRVDALSAAQQSKFAAASDDMKTKFDAALEAAKSDGAELKRIYLVWKKELNEMGVAQAVIKSAMEDFKRSQEADRAKIAILSTFSPKNTYGHNIFVGANAASTLKNHTVAGGDDPTVASFNTAVGENAMATNQQGHSNTALGADALGLNNDGFFNVALGRNTLGQNKSGQGNVAVGSATMYGNVSGHHNSAVGLQALYKLEDGHDNSAFGRDAMFSNKSGSWNSAFGVDSLPGLMSGQGNSAFGGEAGYTEEPNNQLTSGSFNSWFGYQSGPASRKQVSNSIAIGYRAKNTASNQTVIGNGDTAETILFGNVKVNTICVGDTCVDAQSFKNLLDGASKKN